MTLMAKNEKRKNFCILYRLYREKLTMPQELFPFVFLVPGVLNFSCRHYDLSENNFNSTCCIVTVCMDDDVVPFTQMMFILPLYINFAYTFYSFAGECAWSLDKIEYPEGCSHRTRRKSFRRLRSHDHFLMSTEDGKVKPEEVCKFGNISILPISGKFFYCVWFPIVPHQPLILWYTQPRSRDAM